MICSEVIEKLQSYSSEKYKANVVKMGIPEKCSIGVPTSDIRKLAKEIGKSNELAFDLWETGYHEAKLLAVLLFEKNKISHADIEKLMSGVFSWDLCDHLCKNLIIKIKNYDEFIVKWSNSTEIYKMRAAFTLIASAAIHDNKITEDTIDKYLELIKECSSVQQEHVKKAVSWALREIGKIDYKNNEKALILANELKENGNKTQIWIAKDVLKEIENVVKVAGRKRLISKNTKMGQAD
ncbi:MAG: DNA alkylation repair protein [Lachnospiraceae bacterium]|nr:DNA alkylation repair protein [Lachnospiraceae bacterium]